MAKVADAVVELVLDERGFDTALRAAVTRAARRANTALSGGLARGMGTAGARAGTRWAQGFTQGATRGTRRINQSLLTSLNNGMDRSGRSSGQRWAAAFKKALSGTSGSLIPDFGTQMNASAITTVAAALALAAGYGADLGASLVTASGILAAMPAAAFGLAAGIAAVALGASGIGKALQPVADAFDAIGDRISATWTDALGGAAANLAANLGPVETGLNSIAATLARATAETLNYVASAEGMRAITTILEGANAAWAGIARGIQPVVQGMLEIGAAVSEAFGERAGNAIGGLLTQFGQFLSEAAASGQAVAWVERALTVFEQLGRIVANVAGIFSSLGDGASLVGIDTLGSIEAITAAVDGFLNSAGGIETMMNIFGTLAAVFETAVLPAVLAIGAAIAQVFEQRDTQIISIFNTLSDAIIATAPYLADFIGYLIAFFDLISPIVPIVAELVQGLLTMSPVLIGVGAAIGIVAGAILLLTNPIGLVIAAFIALVAVIGVVINNWDAIVSAIGTGASWLGQQFTNLWNLFLSGWNRVWSAVRTQWNQMVSNFRAGINIIRSLFTGMTSAIASAFSRAWSLVRSGWNAVVSAFRTGISTIRSAFSGLSSFVSGLVDGIIGFFERIPDAIRSIFSGLGSIVENALRSALPDAIVDAIPGFADGGVISREMIYRGAEGNRPEVVIPLTKPARAAQLMRQTGLDRLAGGSGTTTIAPTLNIYSNTLSPAVLRREVERALEKTIVLAGKAA